MLRARLLGPAIALASACTPAVPRQLETAAIPALGCTLDVPAGSAVELADDGATVVTRPHARVPRRMHLRAATPSTAGIERRILGPNIQLDFTIRTAADDVGSGGEEASLTGALQVGPRRFAVACDDQGEEPDPTWCVTWLATLRCER